MKNANDNQLRFLSVCSGIEAASAAFSPLGWKAVAFSEIEKFPSSVLAHHYPDVPNLGDFTKIDTSTLGHVDVLCGGTPCQSFSIAGLRNSLDDDRGNLSLEFVRLAHELAGYGETIGNGLRNVLWENVPGVLNTKDNAFGCFLGGLVGADDPIQPPVGTKWPSAGMVSGPKGRAAWRILDAQYFGLAQRRRRVIVVADFGSGADPAAVLFEQKGMHWNPPSSRKTRKDIAPTISARTKGGGGLGTDFDLDGGLIEAAVWPVEIAPTLNAHFGDKMGLENQHALNGAGLFVMSATCITGDIAHTLKGEGFDASEDGTGGGTPIVTSFRVAGDGAAYDEGDRTAPLTTGTDPSSHVIAFSSKDYGGDASFDISPTLRAGGFTGSHANGGVVQAIAFTTEQTPKFNEECALTLTKQSPTGGGQIQSVCHPTLTVAIRGREGGAIAEFGGEVATALRASQGGGDKPHVLAFHENQRAEVTMNNTAGSLGVCGDKPGQGYAAVQIDSSVRRLTPTECERLMGFPDGYTRIPVKHYATQKITKNRPFDMWDKDPISGWWLMSADGSRYKALGNSWAVPKFAWLGKRIAERMPKNPANDNGAQ